MTSAPDWAGEAHQAGLLSVVELPATPGGETAEVAAPSLSLGGYVAWLVVADAGAAVLGALGAIVFRFGGQAGSINGIAYPTLVPVFAAGWVGVMWLCGTYDRRMLDSGVEEFRGLLNGTVWLLATIAVVGFVAHVQVSRGVIAFSLATTTVLSLAVRYRTRRVIRRRLRGEATIYRAVIIGAADEAEGLTAHLGSHPEGGFAVAGVHTPCPAALTTGERIVDILAAVHLHGANAVAVASSSGLSASQLRRLGWALEGTGLRLFVVPALTDLAGRRIRVRPINGLPLLHIEQPEFSGPKVVVKRAIDLVGGAVLVAVLAPVLAVIALAVWIGSGRPILYSQARVGRHGRQFRMFKFRTMVLGADASPDEQADPGAEATPVRRKAQTDPRVTRVGRFLRRHSLDELPQLFNVLVGQMSLVGPRPHRPFEVADYQEDDHRRHLIKPGVTGLWQVSGRAALCWEEAVRLDLYYVENWSVWLDLLLLLKTLRAVVLPRGAY
ncbi:MAG TPA: sugar transferase [Actinomycetota bacterium]|nr:sugar transferase [Actinomycetota bacterium]